MNKEEEYVVEDLEKQLRLSKNVDDITTTIRNENAEILLNLIKKLEESGTLKSLGYTKCDNYSEDDGWIEKYYKDDDNILIFQMYDKSVYKEDIDRERAGITSKELKVLVKVFKEKGW